MEQRTGISGLAITNTPFSVKQARGTYLPWPRTTPTAISVAAPIQGAFLALRDAFLRIVILTHSSYDGVRHTLTQISEH